MDTPLVSVLIPTLNSGKTLEKCLDSTINQTYKNIEIILIDGGSDDSTIAIANNYNCKIFILKGEERSKSLNFGFNKSGGKYIYRLDSDCLPSSSLIEEAVYKCEIEKYDAVAIFWSPDPSISFWSKVRKLEKGCYKYDLTYNGVKFLNRPIYKNVGGFNENLVAGEDYDFNDKVKLTGCKIGIAESEELHIGEPKTLKDIAQKQFYYGTTISNYINKNKYKSLFQLSPIRISLIKNIPKFIMHPILTLGFFIYEVTIYSSALGGYLYRKFKAV